MYRNTIYLGPLLSLQNVIELFTLHVNTSDAENINSDRLRFNADVLKFSFIMVISEFVQLREGVSFCG